jgi:hypothetical protein
VTLTVEPRPNTAPVLSNFKPSNADRLGVASYATLPFSVDADDVDGDTLTWSVVVSSIGGTTATPTSGKILGGHGTVSFTVHTGASEHGATVVVTVSDSFGGAATGKWILDCL